MKARRKLVGDNGGIKFQGKIAKTRDDGCTNTITNCQKDNLIMKCYLCRDAIAAQTINHNER